MLTDITLGQYYPGKSFVHKLDPRTKIIATFVFMITIFMAESALSYGLLLAFVLIVGLVSGLSMRVLLKSIKPLWIIIVLTLVIHIFSGQGKPIWSWYIFNVTREGIVLGIKMSLRLILLLLISSILTLTTSPIVLTDGIEDLMKPFKKLGVPAHELAMMMTIALRFIPTLLEETDRIMKAQIARGADFASGNIIRRAKNMLPILIPLFISSFRRADELALAMEARCYRGGEGRTRMHQLRLAGKDYEAGVIIIAVLVVIAFMKWGSNLCSLIS